MASEEYSGVVCADDQDKKNECSNHFSLVIERQKVGQKLFHFTANINNMH